MEREIGSLEAGKRADLVIVDLQDLNQTPLYNVYSNLIYATKAADVNTVVIEGRVVMRDRRLLTLDENDIKARARVFREQIIKSLAPSGTQTKESSPPGLAPKRKKRQS
jgi:5-methylthioadenosine/S-adenosylhomocysteine deaminase